MRNTETIKYRIAEYIAEFKAEGFEYEAGMTLFIDGIDPIEVTETYDTEKEAIEKLKEFKSDFRKLKAFHGGSFYEVTEYILEALIYDNENDLIDIDYIKTAEVEKDSLSKYYKELIFTKGDLIDVKKKDNNLIKPFFRVDGEKFTTVNYIELDNIVLEDLKELDGDEYLEELEFYIYDLINMFDLIKL